MAFDEILAYHGARVGEQWHEDNPFTPVVRLRNYCMLGLMRHCGLRAGEVLSLREDDVRAIPLDMVDTRTGEITAPNTPVVRIVRRHNVAGDTRKRRAFVKTLGRYVPLPIPLHAALGRYLKTVPLIGRRGVETPMLFVSTQGEQPLSQGALALAVAGVMGVLKTRGLEGTSAHGLRHTFFEEQADHLMTQHGANQESVANILRQLGGWGADSSMPFHYAQSAYRRHSNRMLAAFNEERFASEPEAVPPVSVAGLVESDSRAAANPDLLP
jgi:integrase